MPPVEFEPTISAGERPQTYVLDHAATGTGLKEFSEIKSQIENTGKGESILSTRKRPDKPCSPHSLLFKYGRKFPYGCRASQSSRPNVEVKNEWSYTSNST